jgi:2'-5' RNA ligase
MQTRTEQVSVTLKETIGRKKTDSAKIRSFIAIKVPVPVIKRVSGLLEKLKRQDFPAKWTRPENMHLTLKFLGDVRSADMEPVCRAVADAAACFAPVLLGVRGVGVFPNVRNARVLWTGIFGDTDRLADLQQAIDAQLHGLGFEKDARRFTGHLTLGRLKGRVNGHGLIDMMQQCADWISDEFTADAVYVIQSDLTPSGPVYTDLAEIRLQG